MGLVDKAGNIHAPAGGTVDSRTGRRFQGGQFVGHTPRPENELEVDEVTFNPDRIADDTDQTSFDWRNLNPYERMVVQIGTAWGTQRWFAEHGREPDTMVMLWGDPGVGKSSMVNGLARALGTDVRLFAMHQVTQLEFAGLTLDSVWWEPDQDRSQRAELIASIVKARDSFLAEVRERAARADEDVEEVVREAARQNMKNVLLSSGQKTLTPEWLHEVNTAAREAWADGHKPVFLFLDELNRANPEVLNAITTLITAREVAGTKLEPNVMIVAAGNPEGDVVTPDDAIMSRALHVDFGMAEAAAADEMLSSFSDGHVGDKRDKISRRTAQLFTAASTRRHAVSYEVAEDEVRAAIDQWMLANGGREAVFKKHKGAQPDGRAQLTFRTMSNAVRTLSFLKARYGVFTPPEATAVTSGYIGPAVATSLVAYLRDLDIPNPDDMLSGNTDYRFGSGRPDRDMVAIRSVTAHALNRISTLVDKGEVEEAKKVADSLKDVHEKALSESGKPELLHQVLRAAYANSDPNVRRAVGAPRRGVGAVLTRLSEALDRMSSV